MSANLLCLTAKNNRAILKCMRNPQLFTKKFILTASFWALLLLALPACGQKEPVANPPLVAPLPSVAPLLPSVIPALPSPSQAPAACPADSKVQSSSTEDSPLPAASLAPTVSLTPEASEIDVTECLPYIWEDFNNLRQESELESVTMDDAISSLATVRAEEISRTFSHTRPDGTRGLDILSDSGQYSRGEILGYSYYGDIDNLPYIADTLTEGFKNSPEHLAIIMDPIFDTVGIGVYATYEHPYYKVYVAALFTGDNYLSE